MKEIFMASISLKGVTKTFKNTKALDNITLDIRDGEFFCVLGPPGAGKTTLLRLIVGLEKPDRGEIYIGDEPVEGVHPSKRDIAMIFQNLALYPDRTVFDNIAFPLRQHRIPEDEISKKVIDVSKNLKIDWLLEKLPSQLSGGERQRVAIGRAIVRKPKAYLMDEPLSNLDALLRLEMRVTLKELQTNLGETFIYVTHDQVEALSMGDRIAVLNMGVLQQVDDPEKIYRFPKNIFVATILGNPPMQFLRCSIERIDRGVKINHSAFSISAKESSIRDLIEPEDGLRSIILGIRPEDIRIYTEKPAEKAIEAELYVTEPLGNETIVDVKLGENVIKVLIPSDFTGEPGQRIWVSFICSRLHIFHDETHECIHHASEESGFRLE